MCSAGSMISRTVRLLSRAAENNPLFPLADHPQRPRRKRHGPEAPTVRSLRDFVEESIPGRQRRSLQAIKAMTAPSNSQTAGQTLKQNQRITGESRRQTHSLFVAKKLSASVRQT